MMTDDERDYYLNPLPNWFFVDEDNEVCLRPLEAQAHIRPHVGMIGNGRTEGRRAFGISDRDI